MEFYKSILFYLFFSLIFIGGIIFILNWFLKKYLFPKFLLYSQGIKIIKSFYIDKKLRIIIVEIFEKIYILGIGEKDVIILEKIENKEEIEKIKDKFEKRDEKEIKNVFRFFKK